MRAHTLLTMLAVATALAAVQGDGFKRERSGTEADALKNALEGKSPPPIMATEWLNIAGEPPTWKSLLGKVVVVDFWAHW